MPPQAPTPPPVPAPPTPPTPPTVPVPTPLSSPAPTTAPVSTTPSTPPPMPGAVPPVVANTPQQGGSKLGLIIGGVVVALVLIVGGGYAILSFSAQSAATKQQSQVKTQLDSLTTATQDLGMNTKSENYTKAGETVDKLIAEQPKLGSVLLGDTLSRQYKAAGETQSDYSRLLQNNKAALDETRNLFKMSALMGDNLVKAFELNAAAKTIQTKKQPVIDIIDKIDANVKAIEAIPAGPDSQNLKDKYVSSTAGLVDAYRKLLGNVSTAGIAQFNVDIAAIALPKGYSTVKEISAAQQKLVDRLQLLEEQAQQLKDQLGSTTT